MFIGKLYASKVNASFLNILFKYITLDDAADHRIVAVGVLVIAGNVPFGVQGGTSQQLIEAFVLNDVVLHAFVSLLTDSSRF
jgi:hypothetical protein